MKIEPKEWVMATALGTALGAVVWWLGGSKIKENDMPVKESTFRCGHGTFVVRHGEIYMHTQVERPVGASGDVIMKDAWVKATEDRVGGSHAMRLLRETAAHNTNERLR